MNPVFNAKTWRGGAATKVERDRSLVAASDRRRSRPIIWTPACKQSAAGEGPPAFWKSFAERDEVES
jgi:hypothetical protein